jgi:hypothetical protein
MAKEKPCRFQPCSYTTKNSSSMLSHEFECHRVAAGMTEPPHKCHFCDSRFASADHRRRHQVQAHAGLKPPKGKAPVPKARDLAKEEAQRSHGGAVAADGSVVAIPEVEPEAGAHRFQCPVAGCGEVRSSRAHVRAHMRATHPQWAHLKAKCMDCKVVCSFTEPCACAAKPAHMSIVQHACCAPRDHDDVVVVTDGDDGDDGSAGAGTGTGSDDDVDDDGGSGGGGGGGSAGAVAPSGAGGLVLVSRASRGMGKVCPVCKVEFASKRDKHLHMIREHDYVPKVQKRAAKESVVPKVYLCECGCAQTFPSRDKLMRHRARLPGAQVFTCADCDKGFAVQSDLASHQKYHCKALADTRPGFPCPLPGCDHVAPSARALATHMGSARHVVAEATVPCPHECGYKGRTSKDVKRHVSNVHEKTRDYQCTDCVACFKDLRTLREHTAWAHTGGARDVACEACPAKFPTHRALRAHMSVVHGDRDLLCPYDGCGMSYPTKTTLKRHVDTVHLHTWTQVCEECGAVSTSSYLATAHMATHDGSYRYGKSKGEGLVYDALVLSGVDFLPEVRLPGTKMRFDFWAKWVMATGRTENLLVEVDGLFHHQVYRPGFVGRMTFLGQVMRDLAKTRFALQAGFPLLRLETVATDPAEVLGTVQVFMTRVGAGTAGAFASYVQPKSWTTAVAQWIRDGVLAAAAMPMPGEAECYKAMCFLASNLDTVDLSTEELDGLPLKFKEAVLAVFIREHTTVTFPPALSDTIHQACVVIARSMPEFQPATDGCAVVVPSKQASVLVEGLQKRIETAGAARALATEMMPCWLCDGVSFVCSAQGEAALLLHLNTIHGGVAMGQCPTCPATLVNFANVRGAAHHAHCPLLTPTTKLKATVRCGLDGCHQVFRHRVHFFRHLNACHGAKFTDGMCQRCSKCGFTTHKGNLFLYLNHVCVPGGAAGAGHAL